VKTKRYHLALGSDLEKLQNDVNKLIGEGWQPLGRLVVLQPPTDAGARFLQTMVQYEGEIRTS
jgi:hypothetical protein